MPRSYDSRKHPGGPNVEPGGKPALRGTRRLGPIRGVTPGDDVEVAREIARLWEWHYRLEAQYRRIANTADVGAVVDDDGRGGCYYESAITRKFNTDETARFWPLNESSGGFEDVCAGDTLAFGGSPTTFGSTAEPYPFVTEPEVAYADFDGTNDTATMTDTFLDLSGTTKWTFIGMINPDAASGTLVARMSGANGFYIRLNASRKIEVSRRSNTVQLTSKYAVPTGQWTFVAVTYNGHRLRIYQNGEFDKEVADTTSATAVASATLSFGSKSSADYYNGKAMGFGFMVGYALSDSVINDFMVCKDKGGAGGPHECGILDSYVNIPSDSHVYSTDICYVPNIHTYFQMGWRPVVKLVSDDQADTIRVGFYIQAEKDDGSWETYLTSVLTEVTNPYKVVVGGNNWGGTPPTAGIKAQGRIRIYWYNPSVLFTRTAAETHAFISWARVDENGDLPMEKEPDQQRIPDGTVAEQVPVWDGSAWGTQLLDNDNIAAAAGIAYSKLNLATSIVNADVGAAAAIAYSKLNLATSIVNADIAAGAAIAYSKLNLATSIVNADIAAGAAIAKSKLASLAIVNADVDAAAAIAYSKLNLATSIVNADISASAAIAQSKLAQVTKIVNPQITSTQPIEQNVWPQTGTNYLTCMFHIPEDYVSGDVVFKVFWRTSAASGVAVMRKSSYRLRSAAAITTIDSAVNIDVTPADANTQQITATIAAANFAAGDTLRLTIYRLGDDAGDTHIQPLQYDGAWCEYTGRA